MQKLHLLLLVFFLPTSLFSQISFSNQTSTLLQNATIYSGVAMGIADMNGDDLDDIIRLNVAKYLQIEYQQSDGSVFEEFYFGDLSTNNSEWSLCIADVDANGYNDIFTGGPYNGLKLLKANSTGDNYTLESLSPPSIFLQGSNFVDIDNNGTIDIFACHDDGLSAPFNNDGTGSFTHDIGLIDASSTVSSDNSGNYGSVWTDYDNDGDLDMYLSKCRLGITNPMDGRRINMLFQNDGNNNFTDVAEAAGLRPLEQSWATDFGDIDNDGDLDCFIINHLASSQIYLNNGDGTFTDFTATSGMSSDLAGSPLPEGIQCNFDDYDNDGFVDLLFTSRNSPHLLFQNNGDQTFTKVTSPFPTGGLNIQSAVTGDLNNDGYLDVYAGFASGFNNPVSSQPDKLFINDESGSNFLKILLKEGGNSNAIGTRAKIYGDWGIQVREVRSGESYGIMNSFSLHFGIGSATEIDSLVIEWPNGTTEKMCGIAANETLVLAENNLPDLLSSEFTYDEIDFTVTFTDISLGIPDNWDWDFGDGGTSTDQNPTHTFPDVGPYTVTLSISNDCETDAYSIIWVQGALPVELVSFTAELQGKDKVALQWSTETESNFDYFELERSSDLHAFKTLAKVTGNNTLSKSIYKWIDRFPEAGENYYRLKQVDLDGSFKYSDWVNVAFRRDVNQLIVYPVPAKDKLVISSGFTTIESFVVYNVTGERLIEKQDVAGKVEIYVSAWGSGIYFLEVMVGGERYFERFSKM